MKTRYLIIVLMLFASVSIAPIASASAIDDLKEYLKALSFWMPEENFQVTDTEIKFWVGVTSGNGWNAQLLDPTRIDSSHPYGAAVSQVNGNNPGWYSFPRPAPGTYNMRILCYTGTPQCYNDNVDSITVPPLTASTPTPIATTTPIDSTITSKPKIIPPTISALWNLISNWFVSWLPASIYGGQTVSATANQLYTTQISLDFAAPDTNYNDGTYEAKFGEWFVVDSNKIILKESGWSSELTGSPWTATASFTPTSPGTYYLAAIIDKQTYSYNNGQWVMAESIETKELQQINVNLPGVQKQAPSPIFNFFGGLTAWFNSWFPGLRW